MPTDKQHVRAKLQSGLWLTGQYYKRHRELGGEPGYTLIVGRNSTGAYYADRVVEWQPIDPAEPAQPGRGGE